MSTCDKQVYFGKRILNFTFDHDVCDSSLLAGNQKQQLNCFNKVCNIIKHLLLVNFYKHGIFPVYSKVIQDYQNVHDNNDGNTKNNNTNNNSNKNHTNTDNKMYNTQQNVSDGYSRESSSHGGGNGNNGQDGDGRSNRDCEILSAFVYFLQIGQFLLITIFYCGRLYVAIAAICHPFHVEPIVQYHVLLFCNSRRALSVSKYQLIMLSHKRGCFELLCTSVNGNIAILVCAKGKLCICTNTQLNMVVFNLSMNITVLNFNDSSMIQNSLISTICHILHHQSLSQNPVNNRVMFLTDCSSDQVIGSSNEKVTKNCAIYNKSNNHIKVWFQIIFHTGKHSVVNIHYASDNGFCTIEVTLPIFSQAY